jgi:hypothetical protein
MLSIKIKTENSAFNQPTEGMGYECARILRDVAAAVEGGMRDGKCFDMNGNKVGEWKLTKR